MTLLYLDTSALFKRYVEEAESEALIGRIEDAPAVGTALITRVEVAAALAKAVRDDRMPSAEARAAESDFLDDWTDFTRIGLTDDVAARAGRLAWKHDLRGYDAAQLAAALAWREATEDAEEQVVFACFDNDLRRRLRRKASRHGRHERRRCVGAGRLQLLPPPRPAGHWPTA